MVATRCSYLTSLLMNVQGDGDVTRCYHDESRNDGQSQHHRHEKIAPLFIAPAAYFVALGIAKLAQAGHLGKDHNKDWVDPADANHQHKIPWTVYSSVGFV